MFGAVGQGGLGTVGVGEEGWARKVKAVEARYAGVAAGQGGLGWARCGELRTGKLRCDGSRRSGQGLVRWSGAVGCGQSRRSRRGRAGRRGAVGQGG